MLLEVPSVVCSVILCLLLFISMVMTIYISMGKLSMDVMTDYMVVFLWITLTDLLIAETETLWESWLRTLTRYNYPFLLALLRCRPFRKQSSG